jgi:uncharacterized membrane protein
VKPTWKSELPPLVLVLGMFVLSLVAWPHAPAQMPVHWNAHGVVDRYGTRFEGLFGLPLVALGICALFALLPLIDPFRANYPRFRGTWLFIRFVVVAFLAMLHAAAVLSLDVATAGWIGTGLLFILLGGVLGKLRPNWFAGIRTPWTLASRRAWTQTHRIGGWLLIGIGAAVLAAGAITPAATFGVLIVGTIALVTWSMAYSFLVWRDDPDRMQP